MGIHGRILMGCWHGKHYSWNVDCPPSVKGRVPYALVRIALVRGGGTCLRWSLVGGPQVTEDVTLKKVGRPWLVPLVLLLVHEVSGLLCYMILLWCVALPWDLRNGVYQLWIGNSNVISRYKLFTHINWFLSVLKVVVGSWLMQNSCTNMLGYAQWLCCKRV